MQSRLRFQPDGLEVGEVRALEHLTGAYGRDGVRSRRIVDETVVMKWTRLLWLNGFTALELIVAHCRRSAQGRVHFITTAELRYTTTQPQKDLHTTQMCSIFCSALPLGRVPLSCG